MKLLVLIIVCLCVFGLGVMFTNYHKHKLIIFSDLVKFCVLFESSIRFNKLTINQFIKSNFKNFSPEFSKILNDYFVLKKDIDCNYLTSKEIYDIEKFFLSLGSHDLIGEVENIKNNKTIFETAKAEIKTNNERVGLLGVKLGALCALLIFVIFI